MIIPDDTPASPSKTRDSSDGDGQPDSGAPPPYPSNSIPYQDVPQTVSYSAHSHPHPHLHSYHHHHRHGPHSPILPQPITGPIHPNKRARKRFIRAFLVAMLLSMFSWALFEGIFEVMRINDIQNVGFPSKPGWNKECVGSSKWSFYRSTGGLSHPFYGKTSFDLPSSSSERIFLFSRGSHASSGTINIVGSDAQHDSVQVDLLMGFDSRETLGKTAVCIVNKMDGKSGDGVGIFTSDYIYGDSTAKELYFNITVIIPVNSLELPLQIDKLETSLPNFVHRVSLHGGVEFQSVSFTSSNSGIFMDSVVADRISVKTSQGTISGIINTTSATLSTSNARVDVDVGLSASANSTAELNIKTSNALIDSRISLSTVGSSTSDTFFKVSTKTSNGRLSLTFPAQPSDSVLRLEAKTSNARANVVLHPAYEGAFLLASNSGTSLQGSNSVDPSGKGRERVVRRGSDGKKSEGVLSWGSPQGEAGKVEVTTSNSPAYLWF